jgi:hypothetical protein
MRGPFEYKERQIAIALVVMIIEGEFLLAMGGIIGVVYIEDNGGGRLGVAGNEVVHAGLCEPIEVFAVHLMLQTGEGGGTRQVLRRLQGKPLHAELKQGVVPETIGIIAIRIPRSDLVDTLGQEVPECMIYIGLMSLVLYSGGKAFGEANLAVDATQQEGAKVG